MHVPHRITSPGDISGRLGSTQLATILPKSSQIVSGRPRSSKVFSGRLRSSWVVQIQSRSRFFQVVPGRRWSSQVVLDRLRLSLSLKSLHLEPKSEAPPLRTCVLWCAGCRSHIVLRSECHTQIYAHVHLRHNSKCVVAGTL